MPFSIMTVDLTAQQFARSQMQLTAF